MEIKLHNIYIYTMQQVSSINRYMVGDQLEEVDNADVINVVELLLHCLKSFTSLSH